MPRRRLFLRFSGGRFFFRAGLLRRSGRRFRDGFFPSFRFYDGECLADFYNVVFFEKDFCQDAGGRSQHFRVHFVGGYFNYRFFGFDPITCRLEIIYHRSFGDALAHAGEHYFYLCHDLNFFSFT